MKVKVAQSCPTLCDPMDCSPPGSSIHGILQARILEWVAGPFSRGSSQPRDWTQVSHIAGRFFTIWATREALNMTSVVKYWNFVTVFVTSFYYPGPASPGNHGSVSVTLGWFAFSRILCKWSHTFYILLALFLSLSKIILKFLQVHHVVHSFLLLSSTPLHGYNTGDRHLRCLQYLAMMNKAALHIHIYNALYGYLIYFK